MFVDGPTGLLLIKFGHLPRYNQDRKALISQFKDTYKTQISDKNAGAPEG